MRQEEFGPERNMSTGEGHLLDDLQHDQLLFLAGLNPVRLVTYR